MEGTVRLDRLVEQRQVGIGDPRDGGVDHVEHVAVDSFGVELLDQLDVLGFGQAPPEIVVDPDPVGPAMHHLVDAAEHRVDGDVVVAGEMPEHVDGSDSATVDTFGATVVGDHPQDTAVEAVAQRDEVISDPGPEVHRFIVGRRVMVPGVRVSIIHFHPVPESYSTSVLESVTATLEAEGHDTTVHRLHARDYPGPGDLATTDALVLVYPTWWGGQPAALLDWLQRLLGPWIDGERPAPSPLAAVHHLIVVTTHGSSRLVNALQGEPGRQLLERVVAPLCSPDTDVRWISLYKIDRTDRAEREEFLERVKREISLGSPAA